MSKTRFAIMYLAGLLLILSSVVWAMIAHNAPIYAYTILIGFLLVLECIFEANA